MTGSTDGEEAGGAVFPAELLAAAPGSAVSALVAATAWESTALGPVDGWPAELRAALGICLNSPFPMMIMWGPELSMLYNDAFVPILGAKHPALGLPVPQVWSDAWPVVGGWVGGVMDGGVATYREDLELVLRRNGFDETVYFTFAYSAIPVPGGVGGVLTVVTETTGQVLGTRRLGVLRELGEARSAQITDAREACRAAAGVLDAHREDVPFAVVYLPDDTGQQAEAVAWFGVDDPASGTLPAVAAATGDGEWIWRTAADGTARTRRGLTPPLPDGPPAGAEGAAATAVALPLAAGTGRAHSAVVFGVSPHLVLDDAYQGFLELAAGHLAKAVADAEAQAARVRRAEELAELDRAKTRFFTSVSHELRTPLTLIAGPAKDALADGEHPLPPPQRTRMELVHRNAGRLRRLVDTLLDFSRIQEGRMRAEPVAVDLGALTRGIAESFAPAVERAGLRFVVDCPSPPGPLLADPELWERIVLNLLSNAVKFTPDGEIRVSLRSTADSVELTVRDTGTGIAPDELPHIFERFRQARGAAGRSHEGSGIGLALVRELAALHGGDARAASRPGEGTALTVTLPAPPAPTPAVPTRPGRGAESHLAEALGWSEPAEAPEPEPGPLAAGGDTILVAEDNADLRTYLTGLLRPRYTVTAAADGLDALEVARRLRPDLVLSDVMMPRLDGFGLLRALRADPATAGIPVIFLSARAGDEAAVEGLAAGADDYLAKPFSSADLLARVRSNLNMARLRNHESAWRTALVNAMQDGFFVVDADLSVIEVNDAFTQVLGYPAPRLPWPVPHPWWPTRRQDPEGFALVEQALSAVRDHGSGRFVLPLRHRDGHRLWADVALDSVRDHRDGSRGLLVGTLRDVTAQYLTAERDAAVARLAGLLADIEDSGRVLGVALGELQKSWQAARVSLVRWDAAGEPWVRATTGPAPAAADLPPAHAEELVRAGRHVTLPADGAAEDGRTTAVGAPAYDGTGPALVWLEFAPARPFPLADRTALIQLTGLLQSALSRCRAYDEQRQVALALQRAILGPSNLPPAFAVRYEPAGSTLEVGGDWYDVVELPGGRYGVVVGDVVGSGLVAATAMGQLRSAARALLLENSGPAHVLEALDRFGVLVDGAFCSTVFCGVIDPAAGELRYSSAGHLPALLARPGGTAHRLDSAQAVPLAILSGHRRPEATAAVPAGATLLLYTDGLVERRGETIEAGLDRAAAALAASRHLAPADVVDRLCADLLGTGRHEDDVALLVYRQD